MRIVDAWTQLLEANEALRWRQTDDELREIMKISFPSRKKAATIVRVSWIRCQYNNGTGMFKSRGRAKVRSYAYDKAGNRKSS